MQPQKTEFLDSYSAQKLCEKHKIKFVPSALARNEKELLQSCKKLGYPIALKIVSRQIVHKSDVGGVQLNIQNESQARQAYADMMKTVKKKAPKAKVDGVLVQKMVQGTELIVGSKKDAQFGHTILFGLGGIFVEVLKDFSLRISPLNKKMAEEMVRELKAYPIIAGTRGRKQLNERKIQDLLLKVDELVRKEKLQELDLNPVIATENDVIAIDARISR